MSCRATDDDTSAAATKFCAAASAAAEAAAAQVAGSKRPSGNDVFRASLTSSMPAPHGAAAAAPSLAKRQAIESNGGEGGSDWQELLTHEGRTYFMHVPSGRGQWNRPALLAVAQEEGGAGGSVAQAVDSGAEVGGGAVVRDDPAAYRAYAQRYIDLAGTQDALYVLRALLH